MAAKPGPSYVPYFVWILNATQLLAAAAASGSIVDAPARNGFVEIASLPAEEINAVSGSTVPCAGACITLQLAGRLC